MKAKKLTLRGVRRAPRRTSSRTYPAGREPSKSRSRGMIGPSQVTLIVPNFWFTRNCEKYIQLLLVTLPCCMSDVFDLFLSGSPFYAKITDRSRVTLITDLTELTDENGHLALVCGEETRLLYDISAAGPGLVFLLHRKRIGLIPGSDRYPLELISVTKKC